MSHELMVMEPAEVSLVAAAFVPAGREAEVGKAVSNGTLLIDATNKTPSNITPFQAWARTVCIEHAEALLDLGVTQRGKSYVGFMADMALKGLWGPPRGGTLAMLKKVHNICTPDAEIKWQAA